LFANTIPNPADAGTSQSRTITYICTVSPVNPNRIHRDPNVQENTTCHEDALPKTSGHTMQAFGRKAHSEGDRNNEHKKNYREKNAISEMQTDEPWIMRKTWETEESALPQKRQKDSYRRDKIV
jgi:hypothetical protein